MSEVSVVPLYPELTQEHRLLQRQMILTDSSVDSTILRALANHQEKPRPARLLPEVHHYVALSNEQITGGVTVRPGPVGALISGLYVEEAFRRRGIATALMSHALTVVRQNREPVVSLWVADHNQVAYSWYLRLGFASTAPPTLRQSSLGGSGFDELLVKPLEDADV